nr:putative RNA-directed DNA polymerase [Tanacetum cinerariifolium]
MYHLKKTLYGLKKAPKAWFSKIEAYFLKEGYEKCSSNDTEMFETFKHSMKQEFEMSDLGLMQYFLGVEGNGNKGCGRGTEEEVDDDDDDDDDGVVVVVSCCWGFGLQLSSLDITPFYLC